MDALDTLITPEDRKVVEAVTMRDRTFYNEQAGKDYNQVFGALSGIVPTMRYQTRQRIAGRICQAHKKGKEFKCTHRIIGDGDNTTIRLEIFTVSLSRNAPTYVNWDSAKTALFELILAELETIEEGQPRWPAHTEYKSPHLPSKEKMPF